MTSQSERAAKRLFDEHANGTQFIGISRDFGITDAAAAYDVQDAFVALLKEKWGEPCGYKVGLTSKAMQKMVGFGTPIAGRVLKTRELHSGVQVSLAAHGRIGIEFEVGVRLAADLGRIGEPATREDVSAAVDGVCAAFELIDDRNADYGALDVLTLVADNSWNAAAILSDFVEPPQDLAAVTGTVTRNGEVVDSGPGSAALGHPYEAIGWLADHLSARGQRLRKGDVVLTGSLVKTLFPQSGETFSFSVTEIGDVSISFGN